ncbi:amidohydrolase family protein [Nocardia sp. NPDC004860]|uniref:amidohydrolase family protein n=1 Tax=Nocardia sp. NPDC004860 TaxID=3154557 RepID=UPI0033BF520D
MLGNTVVVDAVVHPYDLCSANQAPGAERQLEAVYGAHRLAFGDRYRDHVLTREEFFADFSYEAMAEALFVESPVDFAVIHSLPSLGFVRDHVTKPARAAALVAKYPQRFQMYATVDAPQTDVAIAQLEQQVADYQVIGLKLYPAFFYDGRGEGWRMDSLEYAAPLLEAARDLGLRNIAVHKALWLKPAPKEAFAIDDLHEALDRFSDLRIQMVHAGTAFLDQTVDLLRNHPNMYATLETTFQYLVSKPELFGRVLGTLLTHCGSEQLMFSSGVNLMHPAPLLAEFADYTIPEAILDEFDLRQISEEDRRNILGRNSLRLQGLTDEEILAGIDGDGFSRLRESDDRIGPWHALRAGTTAGAVS